jgi:hypothetical protein
MSIPAADGFPEAEYTETDAFNCLSICRQSGQLADEEGRCGALHIYLLFRIRLQ